MSTVRYLTAHIDWIQIISYLLIRSLKVLNNNDIDPTMIISKDEFKEAGEATRDFLGSEFDMETLENIFKEDGEIEFGILVEALIKEYLELDKEEN